MVDNEDFTKKFKNKNYMKTVLANYFIIYPNINQP